MFSKSWEELETHHYPEEKAIVGKTLARAPKRKAPEFFSLRVNITKIGSDDLL
jgi:hypothetical protein